MEQKVDGVVLSNSWMLCLDAMKSPLTKYKYQGNLTRFLDWAGIQGISQEDRAEKFAGCGKKIRNGHFRKFSCRGTGESAILELTKVMEKVSRLGSDSINHLRVKIIVPFKK